MMADLARIKRNVRKMVDMGAPETDVDAYIAEEGVTVDDVRNFRDGSPAQSAVEPEQPAAPERGFFRRVDDVARGAADMLSLGLSDEISAGMGAITGIGGTFGDYSGNLAAQKQRDSEGGAERFVGQLAGGVAGGVGLARSGLSLGSNLINRGAGLARVAAGSAADGAILGAAHGVGSGEGSGGRAASGLTGLVAGGVLGAGAPYAMAGLSAAARPVVAPIMARLRPEPYAERALVEALRRAGMTADEAVAAMQKAKADGQDMFTLADALGNSGQRMMSAVARTPNDMRQPVADTLISRQMDQGRRVASALQEASGSPLTAAQYKTLLEQARSSQAAKNYAPVKADTSAIDVTRPVDIANRAISPVADNLAKARQVPPTGLAERAGIERAEASIRDPIRQAIKQARSYLASDRLTVMNVEKAFRAKTNIDQMIATATERGQGGMVAELIPVRDALDEALAKTSKQYAAARDAYKQSSGYIDAIDTGRQMAAPRTRLEDNLNRFGSLPDELAERSARVGYFDPLITQAENRAGQMSNSVRPFISQRMRRELPAFAAPGKADQLGRRLGREQRMFETTNAALGGSRTADNLADAAEMAKFDPGVLMNLLRGRPLQAAVDGVTRMINESKGMPPRVIERIAKALIETNPEAARAFLKPGALRQIKADARRALGNALIINIGASASARLASP